MGAGDRRKKRRRWKRKCITAFLIIFLFITAGGVLAWSLSAFFELNAETRGYAPEENEAPVQAEEALRFDSKETEEYENDMPEVMEMNMAENVAAERVSSTEIRIMWNRISDTSPAEGGQYVIMRKGSSANVKSVEWEEIGAVKASDESNDSAEEFGYDYVFTDFLASSEPVQYQYRIDARTNGQVCYKGTEESVAMASNVLICIDPGHYKGASEVSGENMYGYEEGIFTLRVGLALREELAKHGIASYLTRETDRITLAGYTNEALDRGHISLRGEYAAGSNLFFSIHTNANNDNVNGCDTWQQPLEINKTLVIVNETAGRNEEMIAIANEIGQAVTKAGYQLGLSYTDQFERADSNSVRPWTSDYNDSLSVKGTVCSRLGTDGDYYGVLRGAASVGVPGMIVEHGHHTVEEVRKQAMTGELDTAWARADAEGIVKGLGFE